ncbi:Flagellar hook-associated protein FlgK [plant metagenome]|uniref:Flagellar hook-associated protein 1 n=2 Tax=root TaxID=1 RepID=A0A1C3JZF8_9BURK|nr:flagellar hook-associated protein FlgK [Orrella dioscoreae]SBT24537.1 Flagellar hook-associated protein FlgK [Orrella dioscoreae]SOE49544.1 Flagellar hook-associated protein FlgK [Orrella dioscoreae]
MNLYNLGLSGLTASQARLNTTGHNIANADTEGYNRQRVMVSTAGGTATSAGFFGRGVLVDTVQRSYDGFLYRQLTSAQSHGSALLSFGGQIAQVNNLLADRTVGVAPALQKFFEGTQAVASAPADPAARQEMIGQANNLVTQINEANRFLQNQREGLNTQISTTVDQINSYVARIEDLNKQITTAKASSNGQPPNDLYDQRDQLVAELNILAKVNVSEQGDNFNLTIGNGQAVLSGGKQYPLQAVASADDPSRTVVAFTTPGTAGQTITVELQDGMLDGGQLGGLLKYRAESLDVIQNDLGRMAVGLASAYNAQHRQGLDANGIAGGDFFSLGIPTVKTNANNAGSQEVQVAFADANALTGKDYKVSYDGANYHITRLPENTPMYSGDGSALSATPPQLIDGLQFTLGAGVPQPGDSWVVQPTRNAAADLGLAITDPAKIAAADAEGGSANGKNALALSELQTKKILGNGTLNINEAFAQIVNKVGVQTQQNATAAKAQSNLITQNYAAQQAYSGVNLDEEYVNLDRYQQQYRAASRLIDVGSQLFDTLLGLRS